MKRPLAYITAAWLSGDSENAEQAARYCRAVYEAGFSPICPPLYLPLFLNDAVPEEHKSGIDMGRDLLRRSHVLLAWELMGEGRREVFAEALWRYLAFYREHMRLEETMVLPAAQAYLDDDDWAAVDAAFATNVNPLALGRPRDPAYDRLFTRIVMRVKSPLGQG